MAEGVTEGVKDIDLLRLIFAKIAGKPESTGLLNRLSPIIHESPPAVVIAVAMMLISYSRKYVEPGLSRQNIEDMLAIALDFGDVADGISSDVAAKHAAVKSEVDAIMNGGARGT